MALKKSELYSSLWSSCDELRGGMDASQYKDYVLVLLFIKYVSDKFAGQPYAPITIPKLGWIKQQQRKLKEQEREPAREYQDRESHFVWGRRLLLKVIECDSSPFVELRHNKLVLCVRPETDEKRRQTVVEHWYRDQVKKEAPDVIAK